MAASAARLAEPPGPPPRTPERERLADAAERRRVADHRLERLRAASRRADSEAIDHLVVIDTAEAELDEVRRAGQQNYVAALLGDPPASGGGPTADQLEGLIETARTDHRHAKMAAEALKGAIDGLGGAQSRATIAAIEVEAAALAIAVAERGEALMAREQTLVSELGEVRQIMGLLRLFGGPPRDARPPLPVLSQVPQWKQAIERLRGGDVDTALPEIKGLSRMAYFQLQINPLADDIDAVIARAAPSELLSVIYNSPTSVTLNFGPLLAPSTAAATGPLRHSLPPRRH